jgi:hypothetical protein
MLRGYRQFGTVSELLLSTETEFGLKEEKMEDRKTQLSRVLADEYLRRHGYDPRTVRLRPEAEMMSLLEAASTYAAGRLAEFASRAPGVHIHGKE